MFSMLKKIGETGDEASRNVQRHGRLLFGQLRPRPSCTKMSTKELFDACKRGDIARVRQAVADGIDVRKVVNKDEWNETPLNYACM